MAYPTTLDSFPSSATLAAENLDTGPHSTLHGNLGTAVAALEAKLGVDSSAVTTTVDYKLNNLGGDVTGTVGASTVTKIRGKAVSSTAPTDGQLSFWNNTNSQWEPHSVSGDATVTNAGALTLATVNAAPGTTGDATHTNTITTNGKGLVTSNTSVAISASGIGALVASNNLSDVGTAATAATNLGLGTGSNVRFNTLGVGGAVSSNAKATETFDSSTQSTDANAVASVRLNDTRTFSVTQTAAGTGDGQAALRINANASYSSSGDYYGISVGGAAQGAGVLNSTTAYGSHFGVLGGGSTIHRFAAAHIGIDNGSGITVPNGIAYDVDAINALGTSVFTNAIGFRMPDTAGINATNTWGIQIGNFQSRIRGKLGVGSAAVTDVPNARLDILEPTANSDVLRIGSTAGSGGTDPILERTIQNNLNTTNATATQIFGLTMAANKTHSVDLQITWHRTGGSAGATNDGGSMRVVFILKYDGTTVTQIGTTQTLYNIASAAISAPVLGSFGYGVQGFNITGIANVNYTWHCTARVSVVGS